MMQHKGYTVGVVSFDEEQRLFHGEVKGLRDVVTFRGARADELSRAFRGSIGDYLDFCRSRGEAPDRPYPGKLMVRSEPKLRRPMAQTAAERGMSVNQWVTTTWRRAPGSR